MTKLLLAVAFATLTLTGAARADDYQLGAHYEAVKPAQPTQTGDKHEVLELFWYGCGHCNDFEPYIAKWLETKPDDVEFRRMPALFNQSWMPAAKAYYAAEILGVTDKVHGAIFHAIHAEKRKLRTDDDFARFFAEHGVSESDYRGAIDSFAMDGKIKQAILMTRDYGITGVPSVIVNGKYRTSGGQAGSYEELLKVVDSLVDKDRRQATASTQ